MQDLLDKESPVTLPQQLKKILQQRVEGGHYTPGRKIDSVRKIAEEFQTSSLTVQKALKLLEADGFVVSVPGSGIFVNERFAQEEKRIKLVFVFPEVAISREILDPEGCSLSSEIYRGLLAGAQKYGAQVDFVYVDKDMELLQMLRQTKKLKKYDAAVFTGHQLLELQRELGKEKPVFQFSSPDTPYPELIGVDYDREDAVRKLAQHAAACHCKTAGVITFLKNEIPIDPQFQIRKERFLHHCRELGIHTDPKFSPTIALYKGETVSAGQEMPDVMFCNQTDYVLSFYEQCAERQIRIGQDVKVVALASGLTFQGLIPSLTHVRVPMFELARDIVRDACRLIREKIPVEKLGRCNIKAPLVVGKSTNPSLKPLNHPEYQT